MLNRLSLNRIGLNRIGLNRIGKPSGGSSDRPYIDPKVLDSLCGVWIMDQNTNESESRNIIKNKIADRGGDLELLNFAYKANSGYNGYPEDFTSWNTSSYNVEVSKDGSKVKSINNTRFALQYSYTAIGRDIPSFKVKISNLTEGYIKYFYRNEEGVEEVLTFFSTDIDESEIIELPKSHNTVENGTGIRGGFDSTNANIGVTIEQLPLYEGALVTDGKDDMIVSQKTVQEMGITNEITVVSMIHQINARNSAANASYTNYIRGNIGFVRNTVTNADKTGIYGYTWNNSTKSTINNILGDKNDYRIETGNSVSLEEKFSVEGYINNGSPTECSEVAIYWTFISNKVLTTDEINQIIGYFKLDKYVTPQVIYDVKRQGLTNDTPDSDWYLKDFSKNGFDMSLFNFAKKLGSGIGKYEVDFNTWTPQSYVADSTYTSNKLHITNIKGGNAILYTKKGANAMKVKITGIQSFNLVYRYIAENDVWEALEVDRDGIYELPASTTTTKTYYTGFTVPYYTGDCDITIEQIPDYEGALVSDGVDDYGKVENLPIYKDYTVAIDRAWTNDLVKAQCLASKLNGDNFGSFSFELIENGFSSYSFGISNKGVITIDSNKKISYQSKYVYNGSPIISGNNVDGKDLFLFRSRDSYPYYAEAAIWSYILFPYTLSEFLLERQLKKYKLGTLYPDMIELRPIIKGGSIFKYLRVSDNKTLYPGDYINVGDTIRFYVSDISGTPNEVSKFTVNGIEGTPKGDNGDLFDVVVTKSPQKIDITIDEYIRYEDIVQPYPAIVNIPKVDGGYYTYGDKIPVGYRFRRESAINLLPELYSLSDIFLNGELCNVGAEIVISKSMVFTANKTWLLDTTEPHAIYSPQKLNIPNSSLKILGYVPDLTGKGNHGKLNNFAYTEDSGVAADGSIKFDGTDDHITIPTLAHGGKCVMMKVNWSNGGMLYDQRPSGGHNTFGIYTGENHPAYSARNNGSTYIDGILNTNIIPSNLAGITHNITAVNDTATDNSTTSPRLGTSFTNATFSNMSLYEFMLFPEIPSEDEIKKLNDVMGIEGGYVESPNYYWDSFGKSNINKEDIDYDNLRQGTDANRQLIDKSVLGLKAIENYIKTGNGSDIVSRRLYLNNVAYNSESGYEGINNKKKFPNTDGTMVDSGWATDLTRVTFDKINDYKVRITNVSSNKALFWYVPLRTKAFYKITGVSSEKPILFGHDGNNIILVTADTDGIYEVDWSKNMSGTTYVSSCIMAGFIGDCNITIEQVAQYPNGLLLDGVEDHAVNTVIPAVTDFTVIAKREWLDKDSIGNECFIHKGAINTPIGETAFMLEYEIVNDVYYRSSSYGGYINIERTNRPEKIVYQTPTSYNGTSITKGSGTDTIGLTLGAVTNNYWKGVFYKMMLYTKTIDQLSINMLKNLFERDELIDVTNPIFKKEEL